MKDFSEMVLEGIESGEVATGTTVKKRRLTATLTRSDLLLGKDVSQAGRYCTLFTQADLLEQRDAGEDLSRAVTAALLDLWGKRAKRVLAVGLGNPETVVDSLGCRTVNALRTGQRKKGHLAAVVPSVYGMTGLETASLVRGVVEEDRPDLVLAVDTLSTRRAERLVHAVQVGSGGVVPGGGVGTPRVGLSRESLGVPVLTLGVPLLARADRCSDLPVGLVVAPKEIDLWVPLFTRILAEGIENALLKQLG